MRQTACLRSWATRFVQAGAAACFAFALPVHADERADCTRIGRDNIVSCALAASLYVREELNTVDALRGRRIASGAYLPSNPVLSFSGAQRRAPGADVSTLNWYASLSQEFEVGGQRASRVRAADASIAAQEKRVSIKRRETAVRAWSIFFDAIAAREQQRLASRLLASSQKMGVVARARADKGLSPTLEADLADAAVFRLLQVKLAADRAVSSAQTQLNFLLGRDAENAPLVVEGDLVPHASHLDARPGGLPLSERPEVQIASADRTAMLARAEALRRSRVPNPSLSVFVQNDGFNERVFGLGVAIPIPLPSPIGRAYAGEIAEANALADRTQVEQTRAQREIQRDIADAVTEHTAHRLAVDALTPEKVQKSEQSLGNLQIAIETGRLGVREALIAQQPLLELLQANIAERHALCLASIQLARALGVTLEGSTK